MLPYLNLLPFFKNNKKLFSDTGDFVAVGNESGVVLVWNVLTHQQEILSTSVSSPVTAVTFIDSTLYSVQSGKLYQWDQKTGQVAETFKLEKKSKITRMTRGINNCILGKYSLVKIFCTVEKVTQKLTRFS